MQNSHSCAVMFSIIWFGSVVLVFSRYRTHK